MNSDDVVIVSAARTPMGSFQGILSGLKGSLLGSKVIGKNLEDTNTPKSDIDEVIMGCVLPAGMGQAPARQASIGANLPVNVGATTVNKMCGSGMKAVMIANDSILSKNNNIVIAGGLESMSNAPYLLPKVRLGLRMGHNEVKDHMFTDGLEDAYDEGKLMGSFAEDTAEHYQFSRKEQDNFAIESLQRARRANENGTFSNEIIPIKTTLNKKEVLVDKDEQPYKAKIEKIPSLRPAFRKNGTVTAANSSSISDGASSLMLMRLSEAEKRGLHPIARILAHSTNSKEPKWFTTAPIGAVQKVLEKVNWKKSQVDLYEINEAFAVVPMAIIKELSISHDVININGGACALGHPVGASGARIITTLLNALKRNNLNKGIAALCIGGGEATAVALELIN